MFVITGGSRGIGAALAKKLATQNQPVLMIGRHENTLKTIAENNASIEICAADISTQDGRDKITAFLKPHNKIQGLIHNAGIIEPIAPIQTLSAKVWHKVLETNLNAPLFLTQALYSKLIDGRVLHIGSGAAHFPIQGWAPYCVSKAGLAMLTRMLQLECPEIATASVMPGIVATEMQAYIRTAAHQATEKRDFFNALFHNQQLITPETVASFLSWLLLNTDKNRYVSQEWDIYDVSHHVEWLKSPHQIPTLE